MLHLGEEELLRPAHAIFFSGCTATCAFCTAARFAFRPTYGIPVTAEMLAARIEQRQAEGARSVCFIGGDPAPHIPLIVETLDRLGSRRHIPAVFNSNFYLSDEALDLLDGAIDIYLPDLKFGPAVGPQSCGERIGGMPDYWRVVTGCIERVHSEGQADARAPPADAGAFRLLHAAGARVAGGAAGGGGQPADTVRCAAAGEGMSWQVNCWRVRSTGKHAGGGVEVAAGAVKQPKSVYLACAGDVRTQAFA